MKNAFDNNEGSEKGIMNNIKSVILADNKKIFVSIFILGLGIFGIQSFYGSSSLKGDITTEKQVAEAEDSKLTTNLEEETTEDIKEEIVAELKKEITEEVTADLKKEISEEVTADLKKEISEEVTISELTPTATPEITTKSVSVTSDPVPTNSVVKTSNTITSATAINPKDTRPLYTSPVTTEEEEGVVEITPVPTVNYPIAPNIEFLEAEPKISKKLLELL
jgi:signal recognition particle GTPase